MTKPLLHLLKIENVPIFRQLQIEEALLRADHRNFCLLNTGSTPAIVMGISGNPETLINKKILQQNPVPVIRRFSGGGTVFINEETLFVTFICNAEELDVPCYPQNIFKWSEKVYHSVFHPLDFKLQENDYVIGNKKFGGNAQYLRKNRWLHHTSLLFDYNLSQMNYLNFPEKVPKYREYRNHADFLYKLKTHFLNKNVLKENIEIALQNQFNLKEINFSEIESLLECPHRKATVFIS